MPGIGHRHGMGHGSVCLYECHHLVCCGREIWDPNLFQVVKRWASGRPINRMLWKPAWKI